MRFPGTLAALGLLAAAACMDEPTATRASPSAPAATATVVNSSATWAQQTVGNTGPGSMYALLFPNDWNGDAVFFEHGIRDASEPVDLVLGAAIDALIDGLGSKGYAVAYSSYSSNGFDVVDAIRRSHQLRGLFVSVFGKPERSYLVGRSMGGVIAEALAEAYGSQYDGALLMCGHLGGYAWEINYIGNIRVLFDYFYPGVLPGTVDHMPPGVDLTTGIIAPAQYAITLNPAPLMKMLQIDSLFIPGITMTEKITSILNMLGFHARAVNDLIARAHGRVPFDNATRVYTSQTLSSAEMDAVNDGVARYAITPDAVAFLERSYEPSGQISFPVLTLHGQRDFNAPFEHEQLFLDRVTKAGAEDFLVQRNINIFGHCVFGPNTATATQYQLTAFDDLVNWVVNGVKPTP